MYMVSVYVNCELFCEQSGELCIHEIHSLNDCGILTVRSNKLLLSYYGSNERKDLFAEMELSSIKLSLSDIFTDVYRLFSCQQRRVS